MATVILPARLTSAITMTRKFLIALLLVSLLPAASAAQVTFERLVNADEEPHNWLTYSGGYSSNRHT